MTPIPEVKCKVEMEENGESESMYENKEVFVPFGTEDDDFDAYVPDIENEENKDFSAQEDLNGDSDWNEGGEDTETDPENLEARV